MPTLGSLKTHIAEIVDDRSILAESLTRRINEAVFHIAGGLVMGSGASPYGPISPPLPDLMTVETVTTSADAFQVNLPADFQREVFYVAGPDGFRVAPLADGGYHDYVMFMNRVANKDLSETGRVYAVCARGGKLYYQGKTVANLVVHYYRKPTPMVEMDDEPDGIPAHLADKLVTHYVCRDIFGSHIEDGVSSTRDGYTYHAARFMEAMVDLVNFAIVIGEPFNHQGDNGLRSVGPWNV